jgi:hypothetical protein
MRDEADKLTGELDPPATTETEAEELFSRLAAWVVERRMAAPAILFLESHRPLSFLGSQAMIMASPLVSFFEPFIKGMLGKNFTYEDYRRFAELMESRENLELLVVAIERKSQDAKAREKDEKAKLKALKREAKEKRKALKRARRESAGG